MGDDASSIKRMQEYASRDEATRRTLAEERQVQAVQEFGDLDALEAQSSQTQGAQWQEQLELDKQGRVKDTLGNLTLILRNDPRLKDIAYNIHRSGIDIHCDPEGKTTLPWKQLKPGWNESDFGALQIYLEHVYTLYTPSKLKTILLTIAGERQYHPIRDYIESLTRMGRRAEGGHAVRGLSGRGGHRLHPRSSEEDAGGGHRRVYQPGIKFDSVVVLNGPQGMGKSSFFASWAGSGSATA